MKRSFTYLIVSAMLFVFFIDFSYARWYGDSTGSNARDTYFTHWHGNSGTTWCPDDNDGIYDGINTRVFPTFSDYGPTAGDYYNSKSSNNANATGSMRCQWWDNENPVTQVNTNSEPWRNGNHTINLQGWDVGGSGIGSKAYCVSQNSGGCTSFIVGNSTTITQEGENYLTMRITDNVGFTDIDTFGPYQIDKTAPGTPNISSSSHPEGTWISDSIADMNITMNSAGPSPAENLWCFDSTDTCTPNQSIGNSESMSVSKNDGVWFFRAMTRDTGGTSGIDSYRIEIDTTDPGSQTASQTAYPGGTNWSNTNTAINLAISDANGGAQVSGIADAYYRWSTDGQSACSGGTRFGGGGAVNVSGSTNTSEITTDGSYRLTMCSIDNTNLGNVTETNFGDYNIDRNAPSNPTITVSNGLGNVANNAWTTNNNMTVNIAESTSGPANQQVGPSPHATLYCAVRGGGSCTPNQNITGGGNIPAPGGTWLDGTRTIVTRSSDTGGSSSDTSYSFSIDTQAPDTSANPANRLTWSNVSTLNISLTSSDPLNDGSNSGIARSAYIVNQSTVSPFATNNCNGGVAFTNTAVYADFAEGTNYIHMCSIDIAGNRTYNRYGYYLVDLTDPVIVDDYGTNDGVWQNAYQQINLTATDAHSGINIIRYCYGAGCTPNINIVGPNVLGVGTNSVTRSIPAYTSNPPTDRIVRYQAVDYAGRTSTIQEVDVKAESIAPSQTTPLSFHNGRDNGDASSVGKRTISFGLADSGGSQLERVLIEVRRATTNSNGGRGVFGAWETAPLGDFTGLSGNTYNSNYVFPFENGVAAQFRIQYWDEAGNPGTVITNTDTLWMDNIAPTVSDDLPAARNGVWFNTPITVDFSWEDLHSGVPATSFRYCEGAGCNPTIGLSMIPTSRTFTADEDTILRYTATDRAGTVSSNIGEIHVRIDDKAPTGAISYLDGWDNSAVGDGNSVTNSTNNRTIQYSAIDNAGGAINSNLRTVILQRSAGSCPITGACTPTGWDDIVTHNIDQGSLLGQTYVQPFENERSYIYRLYIEDWAGNIVAGGHVVSTNVLRMDDVDPSLSLGYTGVSGTWYNTPQSITFTDADNYAGVDTEFYCIAPYGSSCDPIAGGVIPPLSRDFDADSFWSVFYQAMDNANNESNDPALDILIEDNHPLGEARYDEEWVNTDTVIRYSGSDGGAGESFLRTVRLERREADITANDGSVGAFGTWTTIPSEIHDFSSGTPERSTTSAFGFENYTQPFTNRKAYQYRVYVQDVAGNQKWVYERPDGTGVAVIDTDTPITGAIATLKMEDEEADVDNFNYLDTNLSPNGWTNVTNQTIQISFSDTGGSGLSNYVLEMLDVSDSPFFPSLGTATDADWSLVDTGTVTGETGSITFNFTGENNHAYDFRVQIIDDAGNTTGWIQSAEPAIKIDTVDPIASDVTDATGIDVLLANNAHNFIYDVGRNGGAPIVEVIGSFENWNTVSGYLGSNDNSATDNNSTITSQIDVNHSIQDVDRQRIDPEGYREYTYRIIRIEDEAGNFTDIPTGLGIEHFNYKVYANTETINISGNSTTELNGVADVEDTSNIADGSTDTLTAELRDEYDNAIVRATDIGREIDFRIELTANSNIYLNQYDQNGGAGVYIRTSESGGFQGSDIFESNDSFLSDLDFDTGNPGEYSFDFKVYTPTANSYATAESISDPGANYTIQTFQYAIEHDTSIPNVLASWDTGDQTLDNGQDIDFTYGPLYSTLITGDIDTFGIAGEGTQQSSSIALQKSNSTISPLGAPEVWIEFGEGDRGISPLFEFSYFNPTQQPIGEGQGNSNYFRDFSLTTPNGTINQSFISMLSQERGATVLERQNAYFSTHIQYTLDTLDIQYNSDVVGKDNYFGTSGIIDNTIQGGIKVLGQTHSTKQKDIIQDQAEDDIQLLGRIYKASLKKDIVKNAFAIIRNPDENWSYGASPIVADLSDFSSTLNSGESIFNNTVLYYGDDGTNAEVSINPSSSANGEVFGRKTILAYGRNIYIRGDIYYNDNGDDILGIIALSDENGNGGNIYIDPNVTNVVGTLFAEKSVISYDGTNELGGGASQDLLKHQLHIYGSIFSENTIGGSRNDPILCPYYVDNSLCNQDLAQRYDMNYLRRYFTYEDATGVRLPAGNAKTIGGGTCSGFGTCTGFDADYARHITNSDTDPYAVYPVVVEYNSSAQTNPAPLFTN